MKILHFIPSMGGGGAERQLTYLCAELVRIGCEVHVALLYEGPNMERLERSGAVVSRLACKGNHDPLLIFRMVRLMSKIKPDIIQTWLPQMDVLGGIASLLVGRQFIISERCNEPAYSGGWKDRLRLMVGGKAALTIANSQGGVDYWFLKGKPRNRLALVRNAIPFEEIKENVSSFSAGSVVKSSEDSIVFVGRYVPQKNLFVMLEAFKRVLKMRPEARAYLLARGR